MAETKDDIAAERDALRAENEQLRAQLAAAGRPEGPVRPAQTFQLSEGDRQELAMRGVVNVAGRQLTAEQVRAKLPEGQRDIDLGDADAPAPLPTRPETNIAGVDYVWPSVARGQIDPAVAGTPGINGPAADGGPAGVEA